MNLLFPMTIEPYVGVGPIKLGMTTQEVIDLLGVPESTNEKASLACYCYVHSSLQVGFREPGVCEAIELWGPEAQVVLEDHQPLGKPYRDVRRWFAQVDPDMTIDSTGLKSLKYGVALYARDAEGTPRDPVESILVFERGYWDSAL